MRRFLTPLALTALPAALIAASPPLHAEEAPAASPKVSLQPCELPGVSGQARCATYEVYEDRAAAKGRKIPLKVVVLPATGDDPAPDPLFYFAGGPGGSAVEEAPFVAHVLAELRRGRDLVFVDVRGTGGSNPLYCPYQESDMGAEEALESFLPTDEMTPCREELSKRADLTRYTTPIMVDDVDEVRAALGYERINVYGTSGGTRVALVYLRRHPEVVRTAVLEGVVSVESDWGSLARDSEDALDALLAECAAEEACHRAFPDPRADLEAVLQRLEKGPVAVPVTDPESGEERTLRISRNVFVQTLRYMLYRPPTAIQVPALLHRAAAGDLSPFGQMAYTQAAGILASVTDGVYLSVTCTEDIPFTDRREAAAASAGTFVGDFRLRHQLAACERWVRGWLPEGYTEPVRSAAPVLILSGERDPATPAREGEKVGRTLPNSLHVVIPDAGHGYHGLEGAECIDALLAEFVRRGSVQGLEVEPCLASIRRPPFLLEVAADEEIALDAAELGRFTGTYAHQEGGLAVQVELVEGRLKATLGPEQAFLSPVSPLRFAVRGAPPGTYLQFTAEGGAVTGVELVQGGTAVATLPRAD